MAQNYDDDRPDNWWWLVIRAPNQDIHLFEVGEDHATEDGAREAVSRDDLAGFLAAVGGPAPEDLTGQPSGWQVEMAPGRPNHLLEPKTYDHAGNLLPIRAKAGVTLHLRPVDEPAEDAEAGQE